MEYRWPHIDPTVIKAFKQGDQHAFRILYDTWTPALIAYAARICGSVELAEDVVQDLFVHLWEKAATINELTISNYMIRVSRNMAIDAFKKRVRQARVNRAQVAQPESTDPYQPHDPNHFEIKESAIREAIATLPTGRKKIFLLSREENMTYKEIASELNISTQTVANQMSEALKHIRKKVGLSALAAIVAILCYLARH